MRMKVIRIGARLFALLALAMGLASMNAITYSAFAQASTLGSAQTQPLAHAPYATNCDPNWTVISSPNVADTQYNQLLGVAVASSSDMWAVGNYYNTSNLFRTLIEHWDGSTWSLIASPNMGTQRSGSYLYGVAVVSSSDVWTVGYYDLELIPNYSYVHRTLIEHWNGSVWSVVPSPNSGTEGVALTAVAAVSADNVWAVGYYNGTHSTLVEHWDGSAWSIVPSPNGTTTNSANVLSSVTAVSASDLWAVGY